MALYHSQTRRHVIINFTLTVACVYYDEKKQQARDVNRANPLFEKFLATHISVKTRHSIFLTFLRKCQRLFLLYEPVMGIL